MICARWRGFCALMDPKNTAESAHCETRRPQGRARLARIFPILDWGKCYGRETLTNDLLAALIVTIMLIPQSLAYALLAGLPAEVGLYASIAPLVLYAIFGTSRALAVGPVAVASLMTAATVGAIAAQGSPDYLTAAALLAVISGLMLLVMGVFRLGFLASFLSHPVISGFITASGLLIAASQIRHLFGLPKGGENLFSTLMQMFKTLPQANVYTSIIGVSALAFLVWSKTQAKPALIRLGLPEKPAALLARAAPMLGVITGIAASILLNLPTKGVSVIGDIPAGLPTPRWPSFDPALWSQLALPALMISIVGYVETISVAQTLAAKRRQRIDPDQELIALGAANLGAGISGGFPVTGGFARSAVNFDAGAETPAAGAFTAVGMALATLFLTPLLAPLPQTILAATIIVAVLGLIDLKTLKRTICYSKTDGAAMVATILATLTFGVETGIGIGVGLSLALHLWRTSRPHIAVMGQVPGTEHFRNILRHDVVISPNVLSVRIDESLYFPNARRIEDWIYDRVAQDPAIRHVVLMCTAVNAVDSSALESLEAINAQLKDSGVSFHLSEVKGPVMDRLKRTHFVEDLTGEIFLTQADALAKLDPTAAQSAREATRRETARLRA